MYDMISLLLSIIYDPISILLSIMYDMISILLSISYNTYNLQVYDDFISISKAYLFYIKLLFYIIVDHVWQYKLNILI